MKHSFIKQVSRVDKPAISFNPRTNIINLNVVVAHTFNVPCRVNVIFDDETNELTLQLNNENGEVKIESVNNRKSGRIANKALFQWLQDLGIELKSYQGTVKERKGEKENVIKEIVFKVEKVQK